jgi:hypothetical protein
VYLQVAGRLVDVPAALAEAVRSRAEISRRLRGVRIQAAGSTAGPVRA